MRRLLLTGFVLVAAATFVGSAGASHMRYSSISAQSTGGDTYTFNFSMGRAGCATVGDPLSLLALDYGDSSPEDYPTGTVAATQCVGAFPWQVGSAATTHTYDPSLDGSMVTVYSNGGCRVFVNNSPAGCTMRSEASFIVGSGDSTPTMSVPPVVYCMTAQTCTFAVPASDADGNQLRYRMSTDAEMGGTGNLPGISIDPTTGIATWNTSSYPDGLWAADVTVEELDGVGTVIGKTAADFIVALGNYQTPTFVSPTPTSGSTLSATVGQPFSVQITANAPAADTALLSSLGLPAWLNCPFASAADPATVTCTGTPTSAGSTQLVFLATASAGPQSATSYSINVAAPVTARVVGPLPTLVALPFAPPPSGYVTGTSVRIQLTNAGLGQVLISRTADLASPVQYTILADGTLAYPVPPGMEGTITLFIVRPSDGSVAQISFVVDTKAPTLLTLVHVPPPTAKLAASLPRHSHRKFFDLQGVDAGSGIVSMQISPRAGKTWAWRSFVPGFSAPLRQKTVRVRIADAAGNVSDWFVAPITAL